MSTARHIREARRATGWPIGHADPERDDDDEADECPALDDFDEFFAATEPGALDPLADKACADYEAELDARASQ
jgi:hypothetical protein